MAEPGRRTDGGARIPRPRPALGISTFWAVDDTTEENGATEIIPGSHVWDDLRIEGALTPSDFAHKGANRHTARTVHADVPAEGDL